MIGPSEPVAIRLADGRRADRRLDQRGQLELYTALVHSGAAGLIEVVGARRERSGRLGGFRRRRPEGFIAADDRDAIASRALALDRAGMEVFATPASLERAEPGDRAVAELRVLWVDIDEPRNLGCLRAFAHPPHLVAWSGGGGAHAYWRLSFPVPAAEGERAMRMLASELGADRASTNRGRLMRLPGTRHRKAGERWCRIAYADLARPPYDLTELVRGLGDPRPPRRADRETRVGATGSALDAVPPPAYFARIAGIAVPNGGGFVSCPVPAHPDRHPSCFVYPEPGRGWWCFACLAGGSGVDLASAVAGGPTGRGLRGREYLEARARALSACGLEGAKERGLGLSREEATDEDHDRVALAARGR